MCAYRVTADFNDAIYDPSNVGTWRAMTAEEPADWRAMSAAAGGKSLADAARRVPTVMMACMWLGITTNKGISMWS